MSWGERADRFERKPLSTGIRWAITGFALLIIASIVFAILGFTGAWANKAASIVGPDNVEAQYSVVIKNWEALTVAADTACQVGGPQQTGADGPLIVESPTLAYAATYRSIWAKYNAAQADVFAAKLVGPKGYPKSIPNYAEATGPKPNFCSLSAKLAELKAAQ